MGTFEFLKNFQWCLPFGQPWYVCGLPFYQSKLNVLMREMLFDHFQKFSKRLEWFGALFDF
jgi:hypothetical protein